MPRAVLHHEPEEGLVWDVAFAGFGVAGMCLARRLVEDHPGWRVLVVDPKLDDRLAGTFAYWRQDPTPLTPLARARFARLRVANGRGDVAVDLGGWTYEAFELAALQDAALASIERFRGPVLIASSVDEVVAGPDEATLRVAGTEHRARLVFDSRPPPLAPPAGAKLALAQTFSGVEVALEGGHRGRRRPFDVGTATLMDFGPFRSSRREGVVFGYVLPWSEDRAFVETVRIAPLPLQAAPDVVSAVEALTGARVREVLRAESGATLLTDATFERRAGPTVLRIGRAGGRLKPSTGYAVTRILDDSEAIARSLAAHGHPFDLSADDGRYRFLDRVMLEVMRDSPEVLPAAFLALFGGNPAGRVLRFLDERAGPLEVSQVVGSLPVRPFLRAAARHRLG